jgi:hypothetical protein
MTIFRCFASIYLPEEMTKIETVNDTMTLHQLFPVTKT